MTIFTKRNANIISGCIATWVGLVAMKQIPENDYTHWIGVVACGFQLLLTNLGYARTSAGTVIPETVKKFVDQNQGQTFREAIVIKSSDTPTGK